MPRTLWIVVLVFLGFMTSALSQQPAPGTETKPPATDQSSEANRQTGPEQSATEQSPAIAVAPPAPIAEAQPARPAAQAWWERSEWWLVAPTWLLALVSLALAVYTARLWKATSALLKDGRDISRKELRAYAALDEIFFSEASESAPGVHKLRIRNYGQTPAYHMSIWCERASHLPEGGVNPFYDSPIIDGQLLHPVQAYTVGLAAAPLYRIGRPGFFTYGRIIYHDIYQQWWVTRFCFRYEGEGSFVPHGNYNDEEGPFEKRPV